MNPQTPTSARTNGALTVANRKTRLFDYPVDAKGVPKKISEFFGENVFDIQQAKGLPNKIKAELSRIVNTGAPLPREYAEIVAKELTEWALDKHTTHFCHWFQPLTGASAEKHDSFISYDGEIPIERFGATQLIQGEPDASSFPNGGSRSTFEARGYTAWDISSPIFIQESPNGRTMCIPTAFVSYHSDALDVKTPLLRSTSALSHQVTKFLQLTGEKEAEYVKSTCGAEQEYFLIDKAFYFARPDLVMTGRALVGGNTTRNQQLEDHYFGTIPSRVLAFMQELELELYRLGIPAKTRHNEVAPGQFEIAPIFRESNMSSDQNQVLMALIKDVANRHNFVALLHEKPFAGINGSGKHVNWSMSDNLGHNLLEPGKNPHENYRFLATIAVILEAVNRHADVLRMSISGAGNDHRLGANEAPPSIISVFLGDTLTKICEAIMTEKTFSLEKNSTFDLGAKQLAALLKDNTDRNRTSPFAFTGNKFEFRAVGSSQNIGYPLSILNAAVSEVFMETNGLLETELKAGKSIDEALTIITRRWLNSSFNKIVFNGDGYGQEWVKEAEHRGLSNFKTTPEALAILENEKATSFLIGQGVYRASELKTRYNVLLERYIKLREIECETLINMIEQSVIPYTLQYKKDLLGVVTQLKSVNIDNSMDMDILKKVNFLAETLYANLTNFKSAKRDKKFKDEKSHALFIAVELMPQMVKLSEACNQLEEVIPDDIWGLPKFYDMLFIR